MDTVQSVEEYLALYTMMRRRVDRRRRREPNEERWRLAWQLAELSSAIRRRGYPRIGPLEV